MVGFLFWNINKKPLQSSVARLSRSHDVDVVVLAECDVPPQTMLATLNDGATVPFRFTLTFLDTIAVYTRLEARFFTTLEEDPRTRLTVRQVVLPSGSDILLVVTHFPSKLYWSSASQSQACTGLAATIRKWEERLGHTRTVLVGDLNMNPFEVGVVSSHGLHGMMTRQIAARETRTVLGRDHMFFYNPMWGHFGDALDGPPGTYYDARGEPVTYFWNMFDQVLIRPALLEAFDNSHLRIVDSDGVDSLLTSAGLPDRAVGSDHLPIVFGLDL